MRRLLVAIILAVSATQAEAVDGWWVCYGTPLNNPMGRRVCGQGPDEYAARRWCGFDLVDIFCQRSY